MHSKAKLHRDRRRLFSKDGIPWLCSFMYVTLVLIIGLMSSSYDAYKHESFLVYYAIPKEEVEGEEEEEVKKKVDTSVYNKILSSRLLWRRRWRRWIRWIGINTIRPELGRWMSPSSRATRARTRNRSIVITKNVSSSISFARRE